MAIGQIPGNGQDGFTAFGNSLSNAIDSQTQMALKLKMQSTLMRQQDQDEKEKFNREDVISPEGANTINSLFDKIGMKSDIKAGTSNKEALALGKLADLALQKQQLAMLKSPIGPRRIETDEVGIPIRAVDHNAYGVELNKQDIPGYLDKRQKYDQNNTYVSLLSQAHALYNELSVHNALGTGGLFNRLPEDMIQKRAQLMALNQQLGPLEANVDEGVPGGRFSMMLGSALRGSTQQPEHAQSVANDLYYNGLLRSYGRMKSLGSDTVQIPQTLKDTFGGLPHDVNGNLIFQPRDLRIEDGKVYAGTNPTPVYDINSGKPSVDMSVLDKVHNVGIQKGSQQGSSYGAAEVAAAIAKARGQSNNVKR